MKEKLKPNYETPSEPSRESQPKHEFNHDRLSNQRLEAKQADRLSDARHGIENLTVGSNETLSKIGEMSSRKETVPDNPKLIGKDLKKAGLQKELAHIRKKLSKPDRLGSKVIHNKEVEVISAGLSKTLVRPSGMLGGAIIALIGTSAYYFFAKTVGVRYNYFVYIILFVGGFVLGIFIELLARLFRKKQNIDV